MQYHFEEGVHAITVYDKLSHCLLHARKTALEIGRSCKILARLLPTDKYATNIGYVNLGGFYIDRDMAIVTTSQYDLAKLYTKQQHYVDMIIRDNPDMDIAKLEREIQDFLA